MSLDINEPSGSEKCKICGHPAQGIHFGVQSCRACAAFFRRSIVLNKEYTCRRADSKCKVEKLPRDFCQGCRLEKCRTLGMTGENVQYNRDKMSSSEKVKPPLFDIPGLVNKVSQSFTSFQIPEEEEEYTSRNCLEKMEFALEMCRKNQKIEDLEFTSTSNIREYVGILMGRSCQVSNWVMHSEEFRKLESADKLAIFNLVWMLWLRFERLTMTLKIFGRRTIDEQIFVLSDTQAMYMKKNIGFDFSALSDHEFNKITDMVSPVSQKMFDEVAKPLLELEPTSIEVTYMLCHILWEPAGKKLQGNVLLAAERFLDEIANDLHEYYVKQQKISNYASRLARIMAVVRAMQQNHEERQQMFELARLFDVFKI